MGDGITTDRTTRAGRDAPALGPSMAWSGYDGAWRADGTRAEVFRPDRARWAYVFTIETRPGLRGRGLGTALLREILAAADRAGLGLWLLPLHEDPVMAARLRAWYARHGFRDLPPDQHGHIGMSRPARRPGRGKGAP